MNRILSLDVMRGVVIACMILVNSPGTWDIHPMLCHASWIGLTPTDMMFPLFMFIMGITTYLSLKKYNFEFSWKIVLKIVKRAVLLCLCSYFICLFDHFCSYWFDTHEGVGVGQQIIDSLWVFPYLRYSGVLVRFAFCYAIASILVLCFKHKYLPWVAAIILVGYFVTLLLGDGFNPDGTVNILGIVDQAVLGEAHMCNCNGMDPEGVLSSVPGIAHVLIGFCAGKMFLEQLDKSNSSMLNERLVKLAVLGFILIISGLLLHYGCGISKRIWSPTFVLFTCGCGCGILTAMTYFIDIKGSKFGTTFFRIFGQNPLFLYILSECLFMFTMIMPIGEICLKDYICQTLLLPWMPSMLASVIYAIMIVMACWLVGLVLYKKKIIIRV